MKGLKEIKRESEEREAELVELRKRPLRLELPEERPLRTFEYTCLHKNVMFVVSVNNAVGDWGCYCGAVPGFSHENEWPEVAKHGDKIPYKIAELLFPEIAKIFEWRM